MMMLTTENCERDREARVLCVPTTSARKAPPDVLTSQSKRACLCREVPTDHEAHGHRGGGRSIGGAGVPSSARKASVGS